MYVWWCKGYKGWSRILHQLGGGCTHSKRAVYLIVSKLLLLLWLLSSACQFSWTCGKRGHSMRTRSVFENESLMRIRYNFLGIRDKNIYFIPCQFQNRNSKVFILLIQLKPLKLIYNEIYIFVPNSGKSNSQTLISFLSCCPQCVSWRNPYRDI